ncbi:MAG: hypothetical protein PVG39_16985 [Desulfobacteraceae bacterium]|jgi:hypothetical protein
MKYRLVTALVVLVIVFCFFNWSIAEERGLKSKEYMGLSYQYATETNWLFKNSDYVNYESRQIRFYAGKNFTGSWRMEWEFVVAGIKEHGDIKKEEILYGIQTGFLYDFLRFDRFIFYTGFSAGLGYLNHPTGYVALGEESPFGMFEGRLGIEYEYNKNIFLRAQTGVWHISSVFNSDQGQNYWNYVVNIGYRF